MKGRSVLLMISAGQIVLGSVMTGGEATYVRANECRYRTLKKAAAGDLPEDNFDLTTCALEGEGPCTCEEGWVSFGISGAYTEPVMVEEAKTGEYDCPQGGDDYFFDPVDGLQKECVCVTGLDEAWQERHMGGGDSSSDDSSSSGNSGESGDTFWAMNPSVFSSCHGQLICGRPKVAYTVKPKRRIDTPSYELGAYNFLGPIDSDGTPISAAEDVNHLDSLFKDACGWEDDSEISNGDYEAPTVCVCKPEA